MLKRATARSRAAVGKTKTTTATATTNKTATSDFHATDPGGTPSDELIEHVRVKITNAHVFKLPPKPSSGGWRGADWRDKVWQGTLKVVERGEQTSVLLVDSKEERNIFAVCPIQHNADGNNNNMGNGVDRCIDSSRYFVLRIQNAQGRHMYIGLAFNERNDAFDFNTALEDSRREKEGERKVALGISGVGKGVNYKMKEGEKIRVSIPKIPSTECGGDDDTSPSEGGYKKPQSAAAKRRESRKAGQARNSASGGFLKPSSKDTPSRIV